MITFIADGYLNMHPASTHRSYKDNFSIVHQLRSMGDNPYVCVTTWQGSGLFDIVLSMPNYVEILNMFNVHTRPSSLSPLSEKAMCTITAILRLDGLTGK